MASVMRSSGFIRRRSWLGSGPLLVGREEQARRAVELDDGLGERLGRFLPARMKKGTPAQRHESMWKRTAANVSTSESGATPGSSR